MTHEPHSCAATDRLVEELQEKVQELEARLAAERERCARIAEAHGLEVGEHCWNHENRPQANSACWVEIARAIRDGATAPPAQAPVIPPIVLNYMRLVAEELLDDTATEDDLYALWVQMTQAEKDLANALVEHIFGKWIGS